MDVDVVVVIDADVVAVVLVDATAVLPGRHPCACSAPSFDRGVVHEHDSDYDHDHVHV
jgi:hypothetical protein